MSFSLSPRRTSVERTSGRFGDLDTVVLTHPNGSKAEFTRFGAHAVSLRPLGDCRDILFVSPESCLDGTAPPRGGMPHCFPWFGPGENGLPLHGIVRTQEAILVGNPPNCVDPESVTFVITDNQDTRAQWDNRFLYEITYSLLPDGLDTKVLVRNRNADGDIAFQLALHTYFQVDARSVEIRGLQGLEYTDKLLNGEKVLRSDPEPVLKFTGYTDRVYHDAPPETVVANGLRKLVITEENLPDAVAWCAFGEKELPDLPIESQFRYCCLERGAINEPVTLVPDQEWRCRMTIKWSYS